MSGVTESKGGEAAAGAGGDESKQQAIMARWGGAPISAEESVVLGPKNEMGYPPILFFDDIGESLAASGMACDAVIAQLTQMMNKYEVLERSMLPKLEALKQKLPELRKTIQMIEFLRKKQELGEEFHTHFNLSDGVHAKAAVKPKNVVYLWLGAKTMLEYSYDEATELLTTNLNESTAQLEDLQKRQQFIRAQITTAQVSASRLFNWDQQRRRKERAAAAAQ